MRTKRISMELVKWSYQHTKLSHTGAETTIESKRVFDTPSECMRAWDSGVDSVEKRLHCKASGHSWHDYNVWQSVCGINDQGKIEAHIWQAVAVVEADDE